MENQKQNISCSKKINQIIQQEKLLIFQTFFTYCFLVLIFLNIFNSNTYLSQYSSTIQNRLNDKVQLIVGTLKKPSLSLENNKIQNIKKGNISFNLDDNFLLQLQLLQLLFLMQTIKSFYDKKVKKLASKLKANLVLGPIKSFKRSMEKVKYEYNGDLNRLNDVLRSSLVFNNLKDLYQGLNRISKNFRVIKIKDRFKNPTSSYKDVNLVVLLKNRFKAEIQLHLSEIFKAKKVETKIYEKIRSLQNQLNLTENNQEQKAIEQKLSQLKSQKDKIYNQAWNKHRTIQA